MALRDCVKLSFHSRQAAYVDEVRGLLTAARDGISWTGRDVGRCDHPIMLGSRA